MSNDAIGRRELLRVAGLMGLGAFSLALTPEALAQAQARVTKSPVQRRTIVIDPGHGGIDPGCIGYSGTYEKHIAFDTAQEIGRLLEATGRFHPVMTRTRDEFIPLHDRVVRARAANADLFLSIHADSIPDHSLRGASVFTLSEKASDAQSAALAAKENHSDVVGKLGTEVRMLDHSHRSAGFAVLKAPDIPSALVELGCLSNRDEDVLLRTASYRHKLATGIVGSVDAYFSQVVRA